jgi:ATP-dependent RNA helicase DDX1
MRSMDERRASLQALKDGDVRILICTDVAARGIDIEGLPYVINMTLPDEAENYVHRIGRVGRADRMGLAFSIVAANGVGEQVWYHKCANRGKNCENRALLENGGCTMWYDEGMCLAKVEKLLNQRIPELQADLSLPEELKSLNVKYGADVKQNEQVMSVHVAQLSESVRDLAMMEMRAQNAFLDLSHRVW